MYSLAGYGQMIEDRVRLDAYARALRKTVRPGSVVLEIGTGPGIFAVLACQLGARRVYAIEPTPIIQVAREIAAANGCADRIEFIEDLSTRVTLPIQADVIVSDSARHTSFVSNPSAFYCRCPPPFPRARRHAHTQEGRHMGFDRRSARTVLQGRGCLGKGCPRTGFESGSPPGCERLPESACHAPAVAGPAAGLGNA